MNEPGRNANRSPGQPQNQISSCVPLSAAAAGAKVAAREAISRPRKMPPPLNPTPPRTPASGAGPLNVAVVEDDTGLRRSLERLLNLSPGFRCACSFGSGEEALKAIPRSPPDIVLMDIHLPNRSGIECTALLRQQLPQLQIIMLTVYNDSDTLFKALRTGACGYLLKRARPEEILEALSEAQRGGAPMSSEIARQVVAAFQEPAPADSQDEALSRREQEILDALLKGFSNKDIAAQLSISVFTVKNHLRHIYEKLHVRSRTDVLLKYRDSSAILPVPNSSRK
jgi:DNA-binding NarL/FixJ family response regulator